jgi:hypothetical protein
MNAEREIFRVYRLRPDLWAVLRPGSQVENGFSDIDDAIAFIRAERRGADAVVELQIDDFYAVLSLGPGDKLPDDLVKHD